MRLVVDANVAVRLSLTAAIHPTIFDHELVAPPLLMSEGLSTLSELAYRGEIPEDQARAAVARLNALPLRFERPAELSDRAWDVSRTLGWAKTYDAEYVALAQLLDCALVTLDARLARGAGHLARIIGPADV